MHFTLWPSVRGTEGSHTVITWEQFRAFVAEPQLAPSKDSLEGWSPVHFAGNRRAKANVESVSAIVLDDDASGLPIERVGEIWREFAGIVHTSHSHTTAAPKYRIILPLSRDVTVAEHARVWAHVAAHARHWGQNIDEATKDASRLWFVPAHVEGAPYAWGELAGAPLDVDTVLSSDSGQTPPPAPAPPRAAADPAPPADRARAMAVALGSAWPAKGRHAAQLALAGALRGEGYTEEEAVEFLCTVCRTAGNEDHPKRVATVRHTFARPADAPLTGWTRLKAFVDPVVVDAARGVLGRDAEWNERLDRRMVEAATLQKVGSSPEVSTNSLTAGPVAFEIGGFDAELPPINYQIDPLIARGEVVMFVAHGNSLKTWLAFSMAHAIASGRPWLGKHMTTRGRAAIVDFESGRYEVLRRFKLLGVKNEEVGDRLLRASYPAAQFTDPETWVGLAGAGLEFMVVDSYNAAAPELDENDARAALMLQYAGRFAEHTGCTVVFVHHSRKGSGGDRREAVRGSTALFAACDRIFEFTDIEKHDGGVIQTTMRSVKDGAGRAPADIRVELSDQGIREVEIPKEEAEEKKKETNEKKEGNLKRIPSILDSHPTGMPKAQLHDLLYGSNEQRRRDIAQACSVGLIYEYDQKSAVGRPVVFVQLTAMSRSVK